MKKNLMLVAMAFAGGIISLGAYRIFFDNQSLSALNVAPNIPVYSASYAALPIDGSIDFTAAAERTVNTVVHVKTQSIMQPVYNPWSDFFGYRQEPQVQMSSGSGVIISNDGYVITNNHVVEGAEKLLVTLNNNKSYEGTLVGRDPSTDIAVIKIEEKNLPAIVWGSSDEVKIGQWVIAVGNPFDLTSTVTAGIVSAKARNINLLGSDNRTNEEVFPVESFIQTDAAVNPGNSGGALVNTRGELIGINTAIASRTGAFAGYSFAVPSSIARKIAQDIIEFGHVQRAFIGVRISDVTEEVAKDAGLKEVAGIQVQSLTDGGAAQDSGIREGDIIQKIGEASVKNVPQLQEQVSRYRPGDKVKVTVWRDSKAQMVDVVLRNRSGKPQLEDFSKASTSAGGSIQSLGATFGEPATEDISKLRITGGAKVTDLQPGKFKSIGMQKGFIVTKIDGMTINNPEDLKTALEGKEGKYVEIKGYYSNGMEAMYGFRL
jgi:Do/DeqQ family serine protease